MIRFFLGAVFTNLLLPILATEALPPSAPITGQSRMLTFEDRVAAQRAIEQVRWSHRTWPPENAASKPALDVVLPEDVIRAKVADYLAKSEFLDTEWHRPVTAERLQAEMSRMASRSRDPRVLRELFAALGNDSLLIAECLVRPIMADRMIRNGYASDQRIHAEARREAERAIASMRSQASIPPVGQNYQEATFRREPLSTNAVNERDFDESSELLTAAEWERSIASVASRFGEEINAAEVTDGASGVRPQIDPDAVLLAMPMNQISPLRDDRDSFSAVALVTRTMDSYAVASFHWPKTSFETWWKRQRKFEPSLPIVPANGYSSVEIASESCIDNTWSPTRIDLPEARYGHTAIWTGSEMLIWGGIGGGVIRNDGGRYDASTDAWLPISTGGAAAAGVAGQTAVWTGTEMIVWGGQNVTGVNSNTGSRYDPLTDTWTATSTSAGVPSERNAHSAVWSGSEMIVWGGRSGNGSDLRTGGRYNPATDTWVPTSTGLEVPVARSGQTAVWTGREMIVWGGVIFHSGTGQSTPLATGGRYDPQLDSWQPTSTVAGVPEARRRHTAVWTGQAMILWGGDGSTFFNSGGRYDPSTDTWLPVTAAASTPTPRRGHSAVWTGDEMIVWGGLDSSATYSTQGGRYSPATDSWTPTSTAVGVPEGRQSSAAIWTGEEMILWGGLNSTVAGLRTGARYDPSTDTWSATTLGGEVPTSRSGHTATWTGSEMIIWGGYSDGPALPLNTGGRYDLATDSWSPTSTGLNVPASRQRHSAIWTGLDMIVWGGTRPGGSLNTGSRYDPLTDTWLPVSSGAGVPSARTGHTATWAGDQMIVWGGVSSAGRVKTGGRYYPSLDLWTPTNSGTTAPSARDGHSAVWTGRELIVWGGSGNAGYVNTGGQYDPNADAWSPTGTGANVPSVRSGAPAIWTGQEMVVWGGYQGGSNSLGTGGRYDSRLKTWRPAGTSFNGPAPRYGHSAVWTGSEMIVWGGTVLDPITIVQIPVATGGRYDPYSDSWNSTSTDAYTPTARFDTPAVWTGTEMLVWGGSPSNASGGRYCAVPLCTVGIWYQDRDGDGFGNSWDAVSACTSPEERVETPGDCNDGDPLVHPSAQEGCNGIDDDCDGSVDGSPNPLCDDGNPCTSDACVDGSCASSATTDTDDDGVCAPPDNCPAVSNPDQSNLDGDALGDACDPCSVDPLNDADGDGVCGNLDNCPAVSNTDQADADADRYGDTCDPCPLDAANDADGDGVCGDADNCPTTPNADQHDTDSDGMGDACETVGCTDSDGDDVCDTEDTCDHSILDPTVIVPPVLPPPPPPGSHTHPVIPCNAGVPNYLLSDGCTISDKIAACDASTNNKGQFDKCVKWLLNQLRRKHVITERERRKIDRCVKKYKKRDTRHHGHDDHHVHLGGHDH